MINIILMDIDGTLMDTRGCFFHSLGQTLEHFRLVRPLDQSLFGMSVDQAIARLGIGNVPGFKMHWESLFESETRKQDYYPGIEKMMQTLKEQGRTIFIITSRSHSTADPLCEDSSLSPYISGCVAAEDTEFHKPHPAPLLRALELLGAGSEETIYIGDTVQDQHAALAAGIRFGFAGWNRDAFDHHFPLIFRTPADLICWLGGQSHG